MPYGIMEAEKFNISNLVMFILEVCLRLFFLTHWSLSKIIFLTHWGLVASLNLSNNGLLTDDTKPLPDTMLTYWQPFRTYLIEISFKIDNFSSAKMHLKILSAICQPFCSGLKMLSSHCCCWPCSVVVLCCLLQELFSLRSLGSWIALHCAHKPQQTRYYFEWCLSPVWLRQFFVWYNILMA